MSDPKDIKREQMPIVVNWEGIARFLGTDIEHARSMRLPVTSDADDTSSVRDIVAAKTKRR